jgi:hypothetical protein
VYVTVDVQDITAPEIKITTTGETSEVSFKAVGGTDQSTFALTFSTFKAVDEETSKWAVGARNVVIVLMKKDEGYWERLLPAGVKMNNLKVFRRGASPPYPTYSPLRGTFRDNSATGWVTHGSVRPGSATI